MQRRFREMFAGRNERNADPDAIRLRQRLRELNERVIKAIPIIPLKEGGEEGLPIEQLFGPVVIEEDTKYWRKGLDPIPPPFELKTPADLFKKDGTIVRNIYLIGEAARGKTTYCIWLLQKWCNSYQRNGNGTRELDEWEKALNEFDFVFLLEVGKLDQKRTALTDLICNDEFGLDACHHDTIRRVLVSDTYRCLIILDGIDEWNPSGDVTRATKRMPTIEGISSNVSLFFIMRPWVLPTLSRRVYTTDRVLDIYGLSDNGLEKVIENILVNRYNLEKGSVQYKDAIRKIGSRVNESMISFMRIPLIAVVCVQVLYEDRQVWESMTGFYAEILNMLIDRAYQKHKQIESFNLERDTIVNSCVPEVLSGKENIGKCISLLLKLGKVAFEGLLSGKTSYVFQKRKFEKEIGEKDTQFALHVGLVSQKEARSLLTKNISIRFLHKSLQEFLAAIYIVSNTEVKSFFYEHLTDIGIIMEFSNLIGFICGMCTPLGGEISKLLVRSTVGDAKICQFRDSPLLDTNAVEELYKVQVSWFRELQYGRTDDPITFSVSDIYLWRCSSKEMVMSTKVLLSDYYTAVMSLWLFEVPTDEECGISDIELNDFLCNSEKTRSLVKLCIDGSNSDRSVHMIGVPTLRYLYLSCVKILHTDPFGQTCPPLLTGMSELRWVKLHMLNLDDRGLELSTDMLYIERVELESVSMSTGGWEKFMKSLLNVQHSFQVMLCNTDIDDDLLSLIRSTHYFNITNDDGGVLGQCNMSFTRVWAT